MRVLAPSSAQELQVMLHDALELADEGPVAIRYPNGTAPQVGEHEVGVGSARQPAATRRRIGVHPRRRQAGRRSPSRPPTRWPSRASTVTVWDVRSLRTAGPGDDRRCRGAPSRRHVRGRHPRGRHRHDHRRSGPRDSPATCASTCSACPSRFIPQGKPDRILAQLGLDADGIAAAVRRRSHDSSV